MNRRIRELMVELKKTVSTHRGAEVLIGYDEIEKFAELIVQECLDILDDEDTGDVYGKSVRLATTRIKQHFGVEE